MIAAVTGHQRLGRSRVWVAEALRTVIAEFAITGGITCLAAGADQLFARALADAGLPFTVIVPSQRYSSAFKSTQAVLEYRRLRKLATVVMELPFKRPTPAAFLAAGRAAIDRGEVVVAVWDGEPAHGMGGTAEVVQYARNKGLGLIHIDNKRHIIIRTGRVGTGT